MAHWNFIIHAIKSITLNKLRLNIFTLFGSALFGVTAFYIVVLASNSLMLDSDYSGVKFYSRTVQSGEPRTRKDVVKLSTISNEIASENVCRSDILKAGLVLVLSRIEVNLAPQDYDSWLEAVSNANGYIAHAIRCIPTDGNLWLRMAMVTRAGAEDPERIAELMTRSQSLAPAEISVVMDRIRFYNSLGASTLEKTSLVVQKDIAISLQQEPKLLREVLDKPSKALTPYLRAAIREADFVCRTDWPPCQNAESKL